MKNIKECSDSFLTEKDIHVADKIMMNVAEIIRRKYQVNLDLKEWDKIEISESLQELLNDLPDKSKEEECLIKIFELLKRWQYK